MVKKEPAEPEARTGGRGLLVLEVVFVLVLLVGLALWSIPGALMLGGALGVVGCERAMSRPERRAVGARHGGEAGGGERQ
ncbi:hypothetical protein ACFUIY_14805 [Streptomyces griseorubiginosus]|uniref:hypothetical protein n=1 Tax=Streptomyces griseorubiginosus TaxID=67304 RepID=UPI003630A129